MTAFGPPGDPRATPLADWAMMRGSYVTPFASSSHDRRASSGEATDTPRLDHDASSDAEPGGYHNARDMPPPTASTDASR